MSEQAQPVLKKLECPNCGSPISQHSASTQTIICETCGTHVAVGLGQPENIGQGRRIPHPPRPIKLGDKITLKNTEYVVLGRVVYRGWDPHEADESWAWHEWMVGGDTGQMMWLSFDEKGFGIYRKLRFRDQFNPQQDRVLNLGEGQSILIHERYPAKIVGAEGELSWRAKPGESLFVAEGARSGRRYSVQQSAEEMEIYEGIPLEELEVAKAFGDEQWIKRVIQRARNRATRSTIGAMCLMFALAALLVAIFVNGSGEELEPRTLDLSTEAPSATVPVTFDQTGRPAVINVATNNIAQDSFIDIDVTVVSPDGTRSNLFVQELWHETGVDEDGPWRDTRFATSDMFVPTQTGQHQIELQFESAQVSSTRLTVTVRRNHMMPTWFVIYAVAAGIIGGLLIFNSTKAEKAQ